jgi:hypothetical protein
MHLYLIRYSNDKFVVEAPNSQKAIDLWISEKNREEREVYESKRIFNPRNFSIEEIGSEGGIIRASE